MTLDIRYIEHRPRRRAVDNPDAFTCIACDGHGFTPMFPRCLGCRTTGKVDEAEWIRQAEIGSMSQWGPRASAEAIAWGTEAVLRYGLIVRVLTPREQREQSTKIAEMVGEAVARFVPPHGPRGR